MVTVEQKRSSSFLRWLAKLEYTWKNPDNVMSFAIRNNYQIQAFYVDEIYFFF